MLSFKLLLVGYGLPLLSQLALGSPVVPRCFQRSLYSRANISATTVEAELGPQLSGGSLIFGPDNPQWSNATSRFNTLLRPAVQVVVEPASESDVSKIASSQLWIKALDQVLLTSLYVGRILQ